MKRISAWIVSLLLVFSQTSYAGMLFPGARVTIYQNERDAVRLAFAQSATVLEDRRVYLGGQCVGVALYTEGLLVNSVVAVETSSGSFVWPAQKAGIRKGDILLRANGTELIDAESLDRTVSGAEGAIRFAVKRGESVFETDVEPAIGRADGKKHLGLWLRDSAAGLGTVTYVEPESGRFTALGHAICDADTGRTLTVRQGRIVACRVTGVKKGGGGSAGELQGVFGVHAEVLGVIEGNTAFGLYGTANESFHGDVLVDIGSREIVHEGKAEIYSDFEGDGVQKYEIEITHVNRQTAPAEKSLVLRVTDARLLEKTGGIVQGLSGSPILQDGRLIGAVTHVMLSDASRGYGIFIEWMDAA